MTSSKALISNKEYLRELKNIVIGQEKVLILPIWQIIEDRVGDSDACPTAGCGDIQVRDGVSLQ